MRLFLMADAAGCAKRGRSVPEGWYNDAELMPERVLRRGEVGLCGPCMDARGLGDGERVEGACRGTLVQLANWTTEGDKVLAL